MKMFRLRRILSTLFGSSENAGNKDDVHVDDKGVEVSLRSNRKQQNTAPNECEKRYGVYISYTLNFRSLKRRWQPVESGTSSQHPTDSKRERCDDLLSAEKTDSSLRYKPTASLIISAVSTQYFSTDPQDYIVERQNIKLGDIIGEGQYGVVHQSLFRSNDSNLPVAVKTCKFNGDSSAIDRFLEEAYLMQRFDHAHIVKLVCICSESPTWIVTELAEYGELRAYLQSHRHVLDLATLVLYDYQLASALAYLELLKIVHRDVAARNVFVFAPDCVKLGDFGMSRKIPEGESIYKATAKDKLSPWPIKWLSPENLKFGYFSSKSDVWMFGICTWEILMFGEKPFAGVHMNDAIEKIRNGERLALPPNCPPKLCDLLSQTWSYHPSNRPGFQSLEQSLCDIITEERQRNLDCCTSSFSTLSISTESPKTICLEEKKQPAPCFRC